MIFSSLQSFLKNRNKIHESIYIFSLILIILSLPLSIVFTRYSISLLFLNWIIDKNLFARLKSIFDEKSIFFFAFFYLLHLVSLFYTLDFAEGIFQLDKKLPFLILPLIVLSSPKISRFQFDFILKVFSIYILILSFVCVASALYQNPLIRKDNINWFYYTYYDLTAVLDIQPTYLAIYVCFSILILIYFLFHRFNLLTKAILLICVISQILFLILLSVRIQLITLVLIISVGGIFVFFAKGKYLKGLAFSLGILIFFIVLISQFPIAKERLLNSFGVRQNAVWINQYGEAKGVLPDLRLRKWLSAWEIIKQNWFLGVGPGDAQNELQKYYSSISFIDAYNAKFNTHNQFLQTTLGLGLLGFISLISIFVYSIIIGLKKLDYLFLSFIFLIILSCATESLFERQLGVVFFSMFNSLFVRVNSKLE